MSLQPAIQPEAAPYLFTARELARLATYRAAVSARFYNDDLESRSPRLRRGEATSASPQGGYERGDR